LRPSISPLLEHALGLFGAVLGQDDALLLLVLVEVALAKVFTSASTDM
jgi:hypothetical protein